MISMIIQKKNRSVDNSNARVILLKKGPTIVRIMMKSKAKLGIVFIIHETTCDMIVISVVNMNPNRNAVLNARAIIKYN